MQTKKSKWTQLGSLREKNGKKGQFYIKLGKGVSVTVNGQSLNLKDGILNLQSPVESRQRILASGKARDAAKIEAEIERLKTELSYIKFEIYAAE